MSRLERASRFGRRTPLHLAWTLAAIVGGCGSTISDGTGGPPAGTGGSEMGGGAGSAAGTSGGGSAVDRGGAGGAAGTGASGGSAGSAGSVAGGGAAGRDAGGTSAGGAGGAGRGGSGGVDAAAGGGGAAGTGGATGRGGAPVADGGRESGSAAFDGGSEMQRVSGWLNNTLAMGALPGYAYTNIRNNFNTPALFNKLVTAIVNSCAAFAPTPLGIVDCEAILVSAIVAESSYNPNTVVYDTYSNNTDPTVGLLQIRFSSTVHDYNFYGRLDVMANIGCTWPTNLPTSMAASAWTTPGTSGITFMEDPACSVGLAAWYYFYNATCNGGASGNPVYIAQCCSGSGMAGNMIIGLLSHLRGPDGANPPGAPDPYVVGIECCAGGNPTITTCTGCTGRFAAMIGGLPDPDPFTISLSPEPAKYCR